MDAGRIVRSLTLLTCAAALAQQSSPSARPVFHLEPGIVPPFVVSKAPAAYNQEALLAKLEGSVLLSLVVAADGQPRDIQIGRSLGLGLDQSAIQSVRAWQFKPGLRNGNPVDVVVNEEVFFHTRRELWDWHVVRVVFQTPDLAARPVVRKVRFPPTVDLEQNASVTIAFTVGKNGIPAGLRVVKSSRGNWENEVLAAVRDGWRFEAGKNASKPVPTPTWLEFVRGSHSPIPPAIIPDR